MLRVLLIYAEFPITYWGMQHALAYAKKKSLLPPLGLITLASMLPDTWDLRLVDLNLTSLRPEDLDQADRVFVSGMHIQRPSMLRVVQECRRRGIHVTVGGPSPTTAPELFDGADVIFGGEAEGRIEELIHVVEDGAAAHLAQPDDYAPDLSLAPIPRFDLLEADAYAALCLQHSRGCPYICEFCDIIEIFGRKPRVKPPARILAELSAMHDLGWRGPVLFVDDNFIGNRPSVKRLMPELIAWQEERGYPFRLSTETTVNLAKDEGLVADMTRAGFTALFLGIETPAPESLERSGKVQNLRMDILEACRELTRAGMEVTGGFIYGFDTDTPETAELQLAFLQDSPIPQAMMGMLQALPGTQLWRRLEREGRLRTMVSGDNFDRPNFEPAMDEEALLESYAKLMAALYEPAAYYERCERHLELYREHPKAHSESRGLLPAAVRLLWTLLVKRPYRGRVARFLLTTALRRPGSLVAALQLAARGDHFIRYTEEQVLPELARAVEAVRRERVAAAGWSRQGGVAAGA